MSDFKFLDIYLVADVHQTTSLKHKLYREYRKDIELAEKKLGYHIPIELKQLYEQVGYGFFWQKDKRSFDRLLSAIQLSQINLKEDFYEFDPDLEIYDEDDRLIFFEINEGLYLTILKKDINGKNAIYFFDKKISDSLEEFLVEFDKKPNLIDEVEIE